LGQSISKIMQQGSTLPSHLDAPEQRNAMFPLQCQPKAISPFHWTARFGLCPTECIVRMKRESNSTSKWQHASWISF
jgi:hypothetical protein